jgi:hypothetical protein
MTETKRRTGRDYSKNKNYQVVLNGKSLYIGCSRMDRTAIRSHHRMQAEKEAKVDCDYLTRCYSDMKGQISQVEVDILEHYPCKNNHEAEEQRRYWRVENPNPPIQCKYTGTTPRKHLYCVACHMQYFHLPHFVNHLILNHREPATDDDFKATMHGKVLWTALQEKRKPLSELSEWGAKWLAEWVKDRP